MIISHVVIEYIIQEFVSLNVLLCSKLDEAVNEGTSAAAGCEVQEGEITLKVEANQKLVAAMKKCDLALTFEAGECFSLNSYALFVGCATIVSH